MKQGDRAMALRSFSRVGAIIGAQNLRLLIVLIALGALITSQTPDFLLAGNLENIGLAVALLGLVSMGQTVVIVSGGLDISVGSSVGLASVRGGGDRRRLQRGHHHHWPDQPRHHYVGNALRLSRTWLPDHEWERGERF